MNTVALYIKDETIFDKGSATTGSPVGVSAIIDNTKSFTLNQYNGYSCYITSGVHIGKTYLITATDPDVIYFSGSDIFSFGDSYYIFKELANRVELFNDEKISVTSALQNANDIGKVFTDYSQSFTIPASKHNNKIFKHWYESEVDDSFEHGKRYDGYIEINTVTFKKGNFQLEKANRKNGQIESYTITFYGNLTQLKDLFKDDKLNTLDYSTLNHAYNYTQVTNRIIDTGSPLVMYPLLGSAKKFEYKTTNPLEDITLSTGAIKWNELFPAIKLTSVISFIESKYGITFTGSFLDLLQWTKLRLYCKNAEILSVPTETLDVNFTSTSGATFSEMNLTNNTVTTSWNYGASNVTGKFITLNLTVTPDAGSLSTQYRVFVYRNGVLFNTFSNLIGVQTINADNIFKNTNPSNNTYTFKIDSDNSINFTTQLKYSRQGFVTGSAPILIQSYGNSASQTTIGNIEIKNLVPDITVSDFVTGLIKMFNLMIIPNSPTSFELVPLELYYQAGNINDLTKYIRSEEADIERPKLFKSINFQYEDSNNILNNAFYRINGIKYGDLVLNNDNTNESQSYEIKLPFENVLFERARNGSTTYNFLTASFLDRDLKAYTPKPILLYENGLTSVSSFPIYITTNTTPVNLNVYNRFSNEYSSVPSDLSYLMTSNFGEYQSAWYGTNASKGLFYRHYENYISNLYNPKTRILKIKAIIPDLVLSGLKLNDRVIIRDKRYIINQFTSDLTTGETDFELINDYRGADAASTVGYRYSSSDVVQVDNTAKDIEYIIYLNEYDSFDIMPDTGATFARWGDVSDNTQDTPLSVNLLANATGLDRADVVPIEYYKNGTLALTTYLNILQYA